MARAGLGRHGGTHRLGDLALGQYFAAAVRTGTRWMRARSAARGSFPVHGQYIPALRPISIAPTLGSDVVHHPATSLASLRIAVDAERTVPNHAKSDGDFVVAHVQPIPKNQRNTVFRLQVGQRCV